MTLTQTQYRYDLKGRLEEALFFDKTKYGWTYDDLARVKTEINELGQKTTYEYDQYSQVNAVINALEERTEFKYNDRRKLVEVKDALNQVTRYKYDEFANHVETTFHNGDKVSMGYDGFDRLKNMTNERQFTTKYSYNNLSQLEEIEQPNAAKTNYTYDTLGRMVAMRDANQRTTEFEYDVFNRVVSDKLPLGQTNRSVYNKFGQLESATDFNNDTINYGYDAVGRLKQKSFTDTRVSQVSYTYDDVTSQLKTVTDGRGVTGYDYDLRDRLSKVTHPDTQYVEYGYDVLSNVTSVKTKVGTTSYGYDLLNRLDTVKDGSKVLADYDYDAVGNLIRTKFANSSVETRSYDGRNRLKSLTTKNVVGTTFSGFVYDLDGAGNRTKVTEHDGRVVDYQYDGLNRLTEEKVTDARLGDRLTGYDYDLVGNRRSKTDSVEGTTTYQYDWNDRLLSASNGAGVTQFTYDRNGSMKTRTAGTTTVTYDWVNDGENRLIGVSDGTSQTKYVYDAFGERVATIAGGVRTNYLSAPIWGLPEVLVEYDANGNVTADYVHGNGTVRSRRDNREVYHHTDGLGSTRALTDTVGLVTDRYTYDAYGGMVEHQGTFGNSFQFAGEQRDASTGLDYLRARYYDSSLGRFVSADPFAGFMSDPMSLHNYQYAHANPTRYTDPSGYFSLGELAVVTTILGTIGISAAYVGQKYVLNGGLSGDDLLTMADAWFAGFAHGATGGIYTSARRMAGGPEISNDDDGSFLWQMGAIAGAAAQIGVGLKIPSLTTAQMGSWGSWVALGWAAGAANQTRQGLNGLMDGKWEWNDAFNLLAIIPLARPIQGGAAGALGTMRQANRANAGGPAKTAVDKALQSAKRVVTKLKDQLDDVFNKGGGCFVVGTEILTTEGLKNIEDIREGDWVIADDPTTPGEIEVRQVLTAYERKATKLVDIYVDGEVISATEEHPIWVVDKGWVEPKDLKVGDLLETEDGRVVDIDKVEKREGDFKVYNFRVEGTPTYFVSELGILVHNNSANCPDGTIDPRNLVPSQPRGEMTGSRTKRYEKSMKESGFNSDFPITITEVNGRKIILDGHHRVEAARRAGITEVPYKEITLSPEDADRLIDDVINSSRHRF
jgi:RHS repeat-associated protein